MEGLIAMKIKNEPAAKNDKRPFFCRLPLVTAAMLAMATAMMGAGADWKTNVAENRALPSGPGLAAQYPGDTGLQTNSQVIFADNFESGNIGAGWDETGNKNGKVLEFAASD